MAQFKVFFTYKRKDHRTGKIDDFKTMELIEAPEVKDAHSIIRKRYEHGPVIFHKTKVVKGELIER